MEQVDIGLAPLCFIHATSIRQNTTKCQERTTTFFSWSPEAPRSTCTQVSDGCITAGGDDYISDDVEA